MKNPPIRIRAYFDFMCPWSYLGRARLQRAIRRAHSKVEVEWIPFELYSHDGNHRVNKTSIAGFQNLPHVYAQLHDLAARENLIILHPQYEASSRRALTGYLYALHQGHTDQYMNLVYEHVFEHTSNIASLAVLERIAIKLGWNPQEFISYVENPRNQAEIGHLTTRARAEGVRGIPTYFINKLPVTGALPVNDLVSILHTLHEQAPPAFMETVARPKKKTAKKAPSRPVKKNTKKTSHSKKKKR